MNHTYPKLLEQIQDGKHFSANYDLGKMFVGKDMLTDVYEYPYANDMHDVSLIEKRLDSLFEIYKHSVPGEDEPKRPYFKALPLDELSEDDMLYGVRRNVARFELEFFIIALIRESHNELVEMFEGKWFWQSKKNKDLIILRQWVFV